MKRSVVVGGSVVSDGKFERASQISFVCSQRFSDVRRSFHVVRSLILCERSRCHRVDTQGGHMQIPAEENSSEERVWWIRKKNQTD